METTDLSTDVRLVSPAVLSLEGLDGLSTEITRLSQHMQDVEVTNENIKESKELLARVRKEWSKLDKQRIKIKKEVLEPYNVLDAKLKELSQTLALGESTINTQLKAIEEKERTERLDELTELFHVKHTAYNAPDWLDFDKFISTRRSLVNNKATSHVKKVTAIREFFEKYQTDYQTIKSTFPLLFDINEVLYLYSTNELDVKQAIATHTERLAKKEEIANNQKEIKKQAKPIISINSKPKEPEKVSKTVTIVLKDSLDYELLLQLLKTNNIEYEII